jgi:hypothetical protein
MAGVGRAIVLLTITLLFRGADAEAEAEAEAETGAGAGAGAGAAGAPLDPVWPHQFHALLTQIGANEEDLGVVDLWYDAEGGRNLNIIRTQSKEAQGPLWDNEWQNGTAYYYHPKTQSCSTIDFGVGILPITWLEGATYLGKETVGQYATFKWEKGESDVPGEPFVTYYEEASTVPPRRPVKWVFSSGTIFNVIYFEVGATLPEPEWEIPQYCFLSPQ